MEDLSDDAVDDGPTIEELLAAAADAGEPKRAPAGKSKRGVGSSAGGKRSKAFVPPIPVEYQKTATGYQRYKPKDTTRVYDRRTMVYSDEYKEGREVPDAPAPPTLFCDKYLFHKAKRFLINVDDEGIALTPHGKLMKRISARVVRLSFAYFTRVPLSE